MSKRIGPSTDSRGTHFIISVHTGQKMKFSMKDVFSKCDQTAGNLNIVRKLICEVLDIKFHSTYDESNLTFAAVYWKNVMTRNVSIERPPIRFSVFSVNNVSPRHWNRFLVYSFDRNTFFLFLSFLYYTLTGQAV